MFCAHRPFMTSPPRGEAYAGQAAGHKIQTHPIVTSTEVGVHLNVIAMAGRWISTFVGMTGENKTTLPVRRPMPAIDRRRWRVDLQIAARNLHRVRLLTLIAHLRVGCFIHR